MSRQWVTLTLLAFSAGVSSLKLWETPGNISTGVPASCRAVLVTDLACGPRFIRSNELQTKYDLTTDFLKEYCTSECNDSLESYVEKVNTTCGSKAYDWGEGISQSGNDVAQPLLWSHDTACTKDKESDAFCMPIIRNGTTKKCDDCTLKYLASFVGVDWAPDIISTDQFEELLDTCSAKPDDYPTGTQTWNGPTGPTQTSVPDPVDRSCRGKNYTIAAGDTCESIAAANSLAFDRFLSENSLDPECETLPKEGGTVCIGESCKLQELKGNQTCEQILADKKFTMIELLAWNHIIHEDCGNLASLDGHTICISPPGTDDYDVYPTLSRSEEPTGHSTGSWAPGPTSGRPAGNDTIPTQITEAPTATGTPKPGADASWSSIVTNCPVTPELIDDGFEWDLFDDECSSMIAPYCTLPPANQTYPSSTTFPQSCQPSVIWGDGEDDE